LESFFVGAIFVSLQLLQFFSEMLFDVEGDFLTPMAVKNSKQIVAMVNVQVRNVRVFH